MVVTCGENTRGSVHDVANDRVLAPNGGQAQIAAKGAADRHPGANLGVHEVAHVAREPQRKPQRSRGVVAVHVSPDAKGGNEDDALMFKVENKCIMYTFRREESRAFRCSLSTLR